MKTILTRSSSLAATLVLGLALASCSDDAAENEAEACDAVENLRTQVDSIRSTLTTSSTVEEWQEARDVVRRNVEEVAEEVRDVNEDDAEQLQQAWDDFTDAVSSADPSAGLAEAGRNLAGEFESFQDTRAEVAGGLDCD